MRAALMVMVMLGLAATLAVAGPKAKSIDKSVVFVIDRSGSMQGPKLETAKKAVMAAVDALGKNDTASLVIFDSEAQVVFQNQPRAKRKDVVKLVDKVQSGGGTNYFPGLKEAFDILQGINARRKHVILLSDGEAPSDGLEELVLDMKASRITVSAIGVEGADQALLAEIATNGEGRLWVQKDVLTLPQLFVKELKDLK